MRIGWYKAYNLYGKIVVTGDKGTATAEIEGHGVEDVPVGVTGQGKFTSYINIYRTKTGQVHGCQGNPPKQ